MTHRRSALLPGVLSGLLLALTSLLPAGAGAPAAVAAERRTVATELRRMHRAGVIDAAERDERLREYRGARRVARRLTGARRAALGGVLRDLDRMAASRSLTVSRLEPLWLTLRRNHEWWTTRELLPSGARVSFPGSELVWQHFPGHGLQIHPLANFGKLNALWAGRRDDDRLAALLDELLVIAVERGGGLAWEYSFPYGGGRFPWVSGLAQGTAAQALSRAGIRLRRKEEVLAVARAALRVFELPPPTGVRVPADGEWSRRGSRRAEDEGVHYLLYSSNPGLRVLNGFAQALVGIHDFAKYANDDHARQLFADGERALRREAFGYDTGAWSLYSLGGREATLDYHRLNRDFMRSLCRRTRLEPYCTLEQSFTRHLTEPPLLMVLTRRVRGGRTGRVKLSLSKISTVSLTIRRGRRVVRSATALLGHGRRYFSWKAPRRAGRYTVRLDARDLAGNLGAAEAEIEVLKPRRRKR